MHGMDANELDRHITGNWGEDSVPQEDSLDDPSVRKAVRAYMHTRNRANSEISKAIVAVRRVEITWTEVGQQEEPPVVGDVPGEDYRDVVRELELARQHLRNAERAATVNMDEFDVLVDYEANPLTRRG